MSLISHLFLSFVKMLGEGKMLKLLETMRFGDFTENFMIPISIRGKKSTAHILCPACGMLLESSLPYTYGYLG